MRARYSGALRRGWSDDDGGIERIRSTCSRRHDHVITVNDVGEHASWLCLDKDIAAVVSAWCEAACVHDERAYTKARGKNMTVGA